VLALVLLGVFAAIDRGLLAAPGLVTRPELALGQLAGAVAMLAVTFVASWPARRVAVIGIAFQIAGAASLAVLELSGISLVALWILNFALVPTTPRRAALAAFGSAATVPLVLGVAALAGRAPDSSQIVRAALTVVIAVIAVVTSRTIYGLTCKVASARRLGVYELVEPLGAGGMGEVWRAEHRTLVRPAAIKLIRHELAERLGPAEREVMNRRFRHEVQATAMLTSPHTVAVYDFGQTDDGELYYVMELLHGLDGERLVTCFGPQPAERVIHLVRQACASLSEAHRRDLVHRDIKPANVYLCALGDEVDFVKLLDFGLVHGIDRGLRLTATGSVSGTPAYLAPETIAHGTCDARSDIYALGCVAYWLLTGTLVFEVELSGAMMAAHIHDAPEPPSRRSELAIPPQLEAIVLACLAKDPAARPQTAAELSARLAAVPVATWGPEDAEAWWHTYVPETLARAGRGDRGRPPSPRIGRPAIAVGA
jgi:eukaryotic-like serine/threonine-protein kinase